MTNDDEEFVPSKDIPVIYVDAFRIGYDAYKFVIDLRFLMTSGETSESQVQVFMRSDTTKSLLQTLRESVEEYERVFSG